MAPKILIPLFENDVAPRFDLATEVLIVISEDNPASAKKKIIVLPRASADQLCHIIITEGVQVVICSGIEDDYYQYLTWKRITVFDSVIGSSESALQSYFEGTLEPGKIF
jgi:predicted Fe-Mo cluster-binding NifX family protein